MRLTARIFSITSFLLFFGCAPYTLEPLTVNHPAHPKAAVAGRHRHLKVPRPCSPRILPVRGAAAEQGGHEAHHGSDATAEKDRVGEGKVIAVVPSSNATGDRAWPDQGLHGRDDYGVYD